MTVEDSVMRTGRALVGCPGSSDGKEFACNVRGPGDREDALEKGMATQYSILAWRIPWSEEPGGLQSTGSYRVRVTEQLSLTHSGHQQENRYWNSLSPVKKKNEVEFQE